MTKRPAPEPAENGRTIGEILLAYGYVDEDRLAHAVEVQKRTGQPLGQLLVEAGTITRLELATALAEQWSDTPLPSREEAAKNRAARGLDNAGDGSSLVSAAALAAVDQQLAGWRTMSHAQTDRLDEIEARLAALDERAGAATEGPSATELHALAADLGQRLTDLVDEVADLRARAVASDQLQPVLEELGERVESALATPHVDPVVVDALSSKVEELASRPLVDESLQAAVRELSERPPGDVEVAARVRVLEEQLATLAERPQLEPTALDTFAAKIEELAARPLVDESLQAAVRELAERPPGDVEVAARVRGLEELVAALGEVPGFDPALLDGLSARLDVVEALSARIEELESRPVGDPGLQATIDELAQRPVADPDGVAVLAGRVEDVAAALEALSARPVADPAALETLSALVGELAARPIADTATLEELTARVGSLTEAPAEDDLARDAVRELAVRVEEIVTHVQELESRPEGDPVTAGRVEDLAVAVSALRETADRPTDGVTAETAARLDELASQIENLAAAANAAAESAAAPAPAELPADLLDRIARLEQQLEEVAAAPVAAPAPTAAAKKKGESADEKSVEQLRVVVDSMRMRAAEQEKAVAQLIGPKGLATQLDKLLARVDELETRPIVASGGGSTGGDDGGSVDDAALQQELRAIAKRVQEAQDAMQAERDKLMQRFERMASSIDWRIQRLEKTGEAGETAEAA